MTKGAPLGAPFSFKNLKRHCERKRSNPVKDKSAGLLRRFTPLRKRFAFVAGNDG
jgi:hypothetical protein